MTQNHIAKNVVTILLGGTHFFWRQNVVTEKVVLWSLLVRACVRVCVPGGPKAPLFCNHILVPEKVGTYGNFRSHIFGDVSLGHFW